VEPNSISSLVSALDVRLGLQALRDRSWVVRYRACMLVAYALRPDALASLRPLLQHSDARGR
jgi:hypothetical protein